MRGVRQGWEEWEEWGTSTPLRSLARLYKFAILNYNQKAARDEQGKALTSGYI